MRYSWLLCALVLLTSLPACFDVSPDHFASLDELVAYQKKDGYEMIDHIGDTWPADIEKERQYRNEVSVILPTSEALRYEEPGHKIRVITLKGEHNAQDVVVFRSVKEE